MRILYHHRTRGEDAQGIHIRALCEAFARLGHEVRVFSLTAAKEVACKQDDEGSRRKNSLAGFVIPHWLYELLALGYNVPSFLALVYVMLRSRPDFVYERYSLFMVSGRLACWLMRVPFMLEVNAPLSLELKKHDDLVFRRAAQWIEDWLCCHADRTLVVSGVMKGIFAGRGVPDGRLDVVHNGVDRRVFRPGVSGDGVRQEFALGGKFVVGFVGWIRPWHGVDLMIEAVARLKDAIPELRIMLVGDGPALPALREQADAQGVSDRVCFVGPVAAEDVPRYVAAMDVAVQPDVTEYASPIKLFEYLAMGKAVIAPSRDNIKEIVADNETAILFPPGNGPALAACVARLHAAPALCARLHEGALRLVEQRGFYWEHNAQRVVDIVRRLGRSASGGSAGEVRGG